MEHILFTLFLSISIATILNIFLKKFGVSHIIGYIITGTLISYFFNFTSIDIHSLEVIAEFGIVFLMFTIGLEFSLNHLKKMKREVFFTGSLQIIITALFVFIISKFPLCALVAIVIMAFFTTSNASEDVGLLYSECQA